MNSNQEKYGFLFDKTLDVLHWHGDRVVINEASEIELIASSNICKEQFFRINPFAYGLQFHVEVEDYMLKKWTLQDEDFIMKSLGDDGVNILLRQQYEYGKRTLDSRINFINGLFDLLKI